MWESLKSWCLEDMDGGSKRSNIFNYLLRYKMDRIYWFQCIGMFVFVFLQTCTKQPIGIHLQITLVLLMAIPMCAKISGAHYNPAVTVSNFLCRFNKVQFSKEIMWMYFKAQLYSACFALAMGYMINNHFLAQLAQPSSQVSPIRIILSEFFATAILVFYTQLVANSETSFAQKDGQKYCFIIALVFFARRSAHVSAFAINPAITMATVVMGIVTCNFQYLKICHQYLIGDFAGAIIGTLAYNELYVPALYAARGESKDANDENDREKLSLLEEKVDSNVEQQSGSSARLI